MKWLDSDFLDKTETLLFHEIRCGCSFLMNCPALNTRGFEGVLKIRRLREMIWRELVDFVAVQETLISRDASVVPFCEVHTMAL